MINSANKYTISDIFNIDTNVAYVIPKYQREYTWKKENWDELIDDILESEGNHFIGSIICINNGTDALKVSELEVIDGQQRLTTISILFCAIYEQLKRKNTEENEDIKSELWNLKWRLIQKLNPKSFKLQLSRQNNNNADYISILSDIGLTNSTDNISFKGLRIIYKCFRHYQSLLETYTLSELITLLTYIYSTILVKIEVDSHSDAFMLFESLNNRGIPLSAVDLIKNKVLSELENRKIQDIDTAFEKWNRIVNNLNDYTIQDRFFRQYYNAFKQDLKITGISKATKSNLIKIYETLIENDPEKIFNDLIAKSDIYRKLIDTENGKEDSQFLAIKNEIIDLVHVGAAPAYTLLLYLFSKNKLQDLEIRRHILNFLMKYFIRRNVTDFPNTRNLDQIFMDLIEDIETNPNPKIEEIIVKFLSTSDHMSSLAQFIDKLNGNVYETNIDATRFILSKIEESKNTREIYLNFWTRDKSNKLVWTIEHIFPEGKNIPEPWATMITNGDSQSAEEIQAEHVHKLGNLTLTGFNQNLSNFDFEKKRDRKNPEGNYIGYKNGLFLNQDLKERNSWTKEDIKNRTHKLVEFAVALFKTENE